MQSLLELKENISFDIQDIQAEVRTGKTKAVKGILKSTESDFNITLTLFLKEFIVIGQLADGDFLFATIDHLSDFLDKKLVAVKKLYNFKSLAINTYQCISFESNSI